MTLLALAAAATVSTAWLAARLAAQWRLGERVLDRYAPILAQLGIPRLARLYPWLPLALTLHVAVTLFVRGVNRQLFVVSLALPYTLPAGVVALVTIVIALALLAGAFTRVAAVALAAIGLLGMVFFGPLLVLEHSYFFGIAAFLAITGRGPFSVDALLGRAGPPHPTLLPYAVPALRFLFGFATVLSGFTEKLWNQDLALAFLQEHPFNLTAALPFALRDVDFIVLAGVMEVTLGALLMTGLWPRAVILLAWVPFNLAVPFLGWEDVVGHLPIYGIILVVLLCGSGQGFAAALCARERTEAPAALPSRPLPLGSHDGTGAIAQGTKPPYSAGTLAGNRGQWETST